MEYLTFTSPRYKHIFEHGKNVARYSKMLFIQLESLHKLEEKWLALLLLAAKYHDIGALEGSSAHHKKSYFKIISDPNLPIADEDREKVAILARYHRKSLPSLNHFEFAKFSLAEQEEICKTASIIRMADALDYGHQGLISEIEVNIKTHDVIITCHSAYDISIEMLRIIKKSDLFERTFGKEIKCRKA